MRKFETLLLLSPELTADDREAILGTLTSILEREKAFTITVDPWGMRDLAYPVQKHMRGHYVRLEYVAPPEAIKELERNIRITDGIFKFVTVRLSDDLDEVALAGDTTSGDSAATEAATA